MNRLFIRKSVQDCENDIAGARRSQALAQQVAPHRPRRRRHDRRGNLRDHRHRDRGRRRSGPAPAPRSSSRSCSPRSPAGSRRCVTPNSPRWCRSPGSAYTYAYASLGELVAWIIGWDLIVEYAVGNIGVAIGWSGYFRELLTHFGLSLPAWLATDFRSAHNAAEAVAGGATDAVNQLPGLRHSPPLLTSSVSRSSPTSRPSWSVAMITVILVIGIRESANSNNAMVLLKIGIILFFSRWASP